MAQIKARIWPSLAYLFQVRLTAARKDSFLGDPFAEPRSKKISTYHTVKARSWLWLSDSSLQNTSTCSLFAQGLRVRVDDVPSAKFGPDVRSAWCRVQGSESRAQCPRSWVDGVGLKGCLVSLAAARPKRRVLEERERTHD